MPSLPQVLRALVVNDNPYAAGTLLSAIRKQLPADSIVRIATDVRGATDLLNRERYHAVVVSHDLPDGKGLALIQSLIVMPRKPAGLFIIGDNASRDIELVRFLKEHSEVTLVEKPFRYSVVASLVRNSILPSQSTEQSYYGLRLPELIQAFALGRRSATIRLIMPDNKLAAVFIEKGELVHVVYGEEEGKDALARIIRSKRGTVRVERECPTAKRTIAGPAQHVLIDIYRQMDEEQNSSDHPMPPCDIEFDEDFDGFFDDVFDTGRQPS